MQYICIIFIYIICLRKEEDKKEMKTDNDVNWSFSVQCNTIAGAVWNLTKWKMKGMWEIQALILFLFFQSLNVGRLLHILSSYVHTTLFH